MVSLLLQDLPAARLFRRTDRQQCIWETRRSSQSCELGTHLAHHPSPRHPPPHLPLHRHGPREPTRGGGGFSSKGVLSCDVKFSPASGAAYPLGHGRGQTPAEANASDAVLQALLPAVRVSTYPKSAIDITVTVLQDDGGAVDACIAAASLALAHAGIQCHGLVAAATVGELPAPASGLCVDLTAGEEAAATNKCSVAMMPSTGHVTSIRQVGELAPDALTPALATAAQAAGLLHSLMREALLACME